MLNCMFVRRLELQQLEAAFRLPAFLKPMTKCLFTTNFRPDKFHFKRKCFRDLSCVLSVVNEVFLCIPEVQMLYEKLSRSRKQAVCTSQVQDPGRKGRGTQSMRILKKGQVSKTFTLFVLPVAESLLSLSKIICTSSSIY